jgi:LDH2 family malate/lactate/ureidoglycolate dehydrogenase
MLNRGVPVPSGSIIDAEGNPTSDASEFYGPPPGALLPFGGHKGYALGLVTDILAGAISGGGCSRKDADRVGNTFLAFVLNIPHLRSEQLFSADVEQLIDYVKSSALAPGSTEIVVPGEPEALQKERRLRSGIAVDEKTWCQIKEVGRKYGVDLRQ